MRGSALVFCGLLILGDCGWGQSQSGVSSGAKGVRLSVVEGDVRVSRGRRDEHHDYDKRPDGTPWGCDSATWEKAEPNLVFKPGYSLAVVTGRAEIAFEDGSTMYLGENSLMSFGKLGSDHESVDLVSGTLSVNLHPGKDGWYRVTTPTDQMKVEYPERAVMRVTAYLDGTTAVGLDASTVRMGDDEIKLASGEVALWRDGKRVDAAAVQEASKLSPEWDAWVANRIGSGRAVVIPASYTVPKVSRPKPMTADLRIVPRTVAEASQPDSYMTQSSGINPISFDLQFQSFLVFVDVTKGKKTKSVPETIGGGPSAIHEGKGGSLRRDLYIPNPSQIGERFPDVTVPPLDF